jgi:hypothetical protein
MSFAVVSLVRVIPLPQSGRWIPVSDMIDWCRLWCRSWLARAVEGEGTRWRLGRAVDVIFDVADLQGSSRRCRDYR